MFLISFKKINNEKGISLIELVVAVAIFSLVMIAASGIFINAMKAQKALIAKQGIVDNMRYVMEFMAKEIRMAKVATPTDQTFNDGAGSQLNRSNSPSSSISFINSSLDIITYSFSNNKIYRNNIQLSSDDISVIGLGFTMNNWNLSSGPAPVINILIKAESTSGVGGKIDLQTSVSPRTY